MLFIAHRAGASPMYLTSSFGDPPINCDMFILATRGDGDAVVAHAPFAFGCIDMYVWIHWKLDFNCLQIRSWSTDGNQV